MPLTVVSVAFPLLPVGPDAVGGAEQILCLIDRYLTRRGHRSIVVAAENSSVEGELVGTPRPPDHLDRDAHLRALHDHRKALHGVLSREAVDIVHLHGHDFDSYLPAAGVPALATIHLPPEMVLARLAALQRPDTWVHGVSLSQHAALPRRPNLLPPIDNGIAVDEWPRTVRRRSFALAFGRVCPEKGFHLALEAGRRAGMPVLLGGSVLPFEEHERYFADAIVPRLDGDRRFIGPLSPRRKRRALNSARCLLVPSLVAETSSLVAMEALACGTPVIAFDRGALPEIVDDGVTGFIVRSVEEMGDRIAYAHHIDPDACRTAARQRFSADRMGARYVERYEWILAHAQSRSRPTAGCPLSA